MLRLKQSDQGAPLRGITGKGFALFFLTSDLHFLSAHTDKSREALKVDECIDVTVAMDWGHAIK